MELALTEAEGGEKYLEREQWRGLARGSNLAAVEAD